MAASVDQRRDLRHDLRAVFATAKLPTNPSLATRILALIRDPSSSVADFGTAIRTDPGLSSRLLKTANSPLFAQQTAVTTVERAVTVLGLARVRSIALGFQLVLHLDRLGGTPFDMKSFWQHSLLRACLARSLAEAVIPERKEEAFLGGLLQDCGIPLLAQVLGSSYSNLYRPTELSPAAFYAVEKKTFPHTHVEAIEVMAGEWNLPKVIAGPLERHHRRTQLTDQSTEVDRLSAVCYFVGGLRFARDMVVDTEEQELREYGAVTLGLDDATWDNVRDGAGAEYERVSGLYGHILPEDVDVTELLGEANRQLVSVASDADRRVLDVETERQAVQREQQRLATALRDYRERAAVDPLTNVLNRGALSDAAAKAIRQNLDDGAALAAFFIDLDNFKKLNDAYSHQVGDNVLKAVAAVLRREVTGAGAVGRYGGEEFVVLVRDCRADRARELAEHLVRSVRALDATALGAAGTITCSLGAIWSDHLPVNSADELFAAADQLMYRAKRSGKDRCCFEPLRGVDAEPPAWSDSADSQKPSRADPDTAELLALARELNREEVDTFASIRKQERRTLVAPCVLSYFTGTDARLRTIRAVTRNVSSGGIGLLVPRPMVRGEAVEVELDRGNGKLFVAGLVAFCRHIDNRIHELGVQFVTHSVEPILSGDPGEALQTFDWVSRATSEKQAGKSELKLNV